MARDFCDYKGVLLIAYLEKGKTINYDHYCSLLDRFDAKIRKKRSAQKKNHFSDYNAHANTSVLTMLTQVFFKELKHELFEHPAYLYLVSSEYYLFLNMKKLWARKSFGSNNEVIAIIDGYFVDIRNHTLMMVLNSWKNVEIHAMAFQEIIIKKNNIYFTSKISFFVRPRIFQTALVLYRIIIRST